MARMISDTIAGSLAWMHGFADGIQSDFAVYHLTSAIATAIQTAVGDFQTAYTTAVTPSLRTKGTIAGMHTARKEALKICRKYAAQIKVDYTISDQAKLDIGVTLPNPNREPVNVPNDAPRIVTMGASTGNQVLKFVGIDETERAKPTGASELLLFRAVGTSEVTDPNQAQFYGKMTKNPMVVFFEPEDNGKIATYYARWASRRGQVGPWSDGVSMPIAA